MIAPLPFVAPEKPGSATVRGGGLLAFCFLLWLCCFFLAFHLHPNTLQHTLTYTKKPTPNTNQKQLPFFGVEPVLLDANGNEVEGEGEGVLAIKRPWPAIMRTVHGDHARFEQAYFSAYKVRALCCVYVV
jgi:hypothetical protein